MMKYARRLLLLTSVCALVNAQAQLNIEFRGRLDYQALRSSNLSNLWGYTDEHGNEYALVGVNGSLEPPTSPGGLSIVDVTDPTTPQEIFFRESAASRWREVKTWGDYAYVTTEAEAGLMIVDLRPLPESTDLPVTIFQGEGWITSHSLFIDENGRLYITGSNRGNGGVIMYDLTQNPLAPVEVGSFDNWYCHDAYARGDTLYAAHIFAGIFSMVDVSDPENPIVLGTRFTPNNFTHNCWLDDSGDFLFTTDELDNAYVAAYNVSDPTDIEEVCRLQSDPGSNAVPHNTYWLHHHLVTSYYTYGVTIYDAARPDVLVEVGHYDTSPLYGGTYNGAWGVYPFFPSGNLIISDIQEGLFVLAPTYVRAAYLTGTVTNGLTGTPIGNATVAGVGQAVNTSFTGAYATGIAASGDFSVTASAPGFNPTTVTGVALEQGMSNTLDLVLFPEGTSVINAGSPRAGAPVAEGGHGTLTVRWDAPDARRIQVLDMQGRVCLNASMNGDATVRSSLPAGPYLLRGERSNGMVEVVRCVVH